MLKKNKSFNNIAHVWKPRPNELNVVQVRSIDEASSSVADIPVVKHWTKSWIFKRNIVHVMKLFLVGFFYFFILLFVSLFL